MFFRLKNCVYAAFNDRSFEVGPILMGGDIEGTSVSLKARA